MVGVSAFCYLSLHHTSPEDFFWHRLTRVVQEKGHKTDVCVCVWYFVSLFCCQSVSSSAIDCLERPSPKWPITCREGRYCSLTRYNYNLSASYVQSNPGSEVVVKNLYDTWSVGSTSGNDVWAKSQWMCNVRRKHWQTVGFKTNQRWRGRCSWYRSGWRWGRCCRNVIFSST